MESTHAMLLRHHDTTQDLEFRHLDLLHKLRDSHMAKQHQTEKENQESYTAQALRDLKHKHAAATKQLPKNLKVGLFSLIIFLRGSVRQSGPVYFKLDTSHLVNRWIVPSTSQQKINWPLKGGGGVVKVS